MTLFNELAITLLNELAIIPLNELAITLLNELSIIPLNELAITPATLRFKLEETLQAFETAKTGAGGAIKVIIKC